MHKFRYPYRWGLKTTDHSRRIQHLVDRATHRFSWLGPLGYCPEHPHLGVSWRRWLFRRVRPKKMATCLWSTLWSRRHDRCRIGGGCEANIFHKERCEDRYVQRSSSRRSLNSFSFFTFHVGPPLPAPTNS